MEFNREFKNVENGKDSWQEWRKHVLLELGTLSQNQKAIAESMTTLKVELAVLKVKAGMWGAVGAAVPSAIGVILAYLLSHPK